MLAIFFSLFSFFSFSQVTSAIDSTSIKIGEQITYHIQVETDTTSLVVFPEGQSFSPLEMIESYAVDTLKNKDKYNLVKKYGLTQFDSGSYTIPRQKIIIGTKIFFTDSLKVEVNNVVIDTTKQGLYDIKPIIEVQESSSDWWKTVLIVLLIIAAVGFLLYWFIWRKKPLSEEEKIALLPPYDRAKLALVKLDESTYLEQENLKDYYSELTFIIRKYLDEKVYDRALESTTDELIKRLNILKEGNQVDLSKEDIKNLESILKRADLVKFAKSAPDVELAKIDRSTIDIEIDNVKEALPEPTEEEKLLDEKYREEQARKKKRNKIILTVVIAVFLMIATFVGFSLKYGFSYVKDTIIGHDSIELLEGDWVTSAYGVPPITITTPKVLKRNSVELPEEAKAQMSATSFSYGSLLNFFSVDVSTIVLKQANPEEDIDLKQAQDGAIKQLEQAGVTDIVVLSDKFTTPNGAEGLKTHGTASFPILNSKEFYEGEYVILQFSTKNILQRISIVWNKSDDYADKIVERIINSVELKKAEE
ncbi:FeoB-associated Cys-rich membrane protein [Algibacter sp. L1A34]|uniref:FeoB-associated Cys-rich membrane protein n=1 Tax=Algibacter sp. L1A34 TaxID=2686365 RepID=UPI00131B168D